MPAPRVTRLPQAPSAPPDEAAQAEANLEAAEAEQDAAREALEAAQDMLDAAEEALADAEAARAEAQAAEVEARAARAGAEGEVSALSAELTALQRLIDRDKDQAGGILDQLRVAPGFEHALGAALGDDLRAAPAEAGSGWRALPGYDDTAPLPADVDPLDVKVTAPAELARRPVADRPYRRRAGRGPCMPICAPVSGW